MICFYNPHSRKIVSTVVFDGSRRNLKVNQKRKRLIFFTFIQNETSDALSTVIFNSSPVASSNHLSCKTIIKFKLPFDKRNGLAVYVFYCGRKQDSKCSITEDKGKAKLVCRRVMGQNCEAVHQSPSLCW